MASKKKRKGWSVFCNMKKSSNHSSGCGGCAYFLGFLGSAIYYISTATGFWNGVWGVIRSLVWPAILVFEVMKYLAI